MFISLLTTSLDRNYQSFRPHKSIRKI